MLNKIKKLYVIFALIILFAGSSTILYSLNSNSEKSFNSCEEVITFYVDCINNHNYADILQTSCGKELARHGSFEKLADRIKHIQLSGFPIFPNEYKIYQLLNKENADGRLLYSTIYMLLSITRPAYYESLKDKIFIALRSNEKADYTRLNPVLKGKLEIIAIDIALKQKYSSQRAIDLRQKQAACYGAEKVEYKAILYKCADEYYAGGAEFIEYNGKFYLRSIDNPYLDRSPYAPLCKLKNKAEFAQFLSNPGSFKE